MSLNLEKQLRFYGAYHNNTCTNTGPLFHLPNYLQLPYLPPTLGVIVSLVYTLLYLLLEPVAGGLLSVLLLVGTGYVGHLARQYGMTANYWALGIHVASWIAQFIGHGKFEGRAPALLDNLFQAFFLAPLFVWLEILFALGYRPELRRRVEKMVEQDIASFRGEKQEKTNSSVAIDYEIDDVEDAEVRNKFSTMLKPSRLKPGDGSSEEAEILKHLTAADLRHLETRVKPGRVLTTDKDYADEIARLEASTRRYTAQTKALTAQGEALQRLSQPSGSRLVKRAHWFSQRALGEAQYAKTLNDDAINELRDRLQTASTSLERLSKTLPSNDSRTKLLATALAKHRADSLRNHLDRIFLDNLSTPMDNNDDADELVGESDSASAEAEELHTLEAGIQALYVEIDDVTSMLVSQEYLQPLQASLNQDRTHRAAAKASRLHSTIQKLNMLTNELSSWDEHAQTVRSGLVLHRHLHARLSQIEAEVKARSQLPATGPASKAVPPKLELAVERCLAHIDGGPPAATTTGGDDTSDAILDLLEASISARRGAVASLAAAAQTSAPHASTASLDSLDAHVSEAQQGLLLLLHQS
ncbi:hypothetical protein DV735_g2478, partial [Chaetothyriales sp. CBS 134920]